MVVFNASKGYLKVVRELAIMSFSICNPPIKEEKTTRLDQVPQEKFLNKIVNSKKTQMQIVEKTSWLIKAPYKIRAIQ